MGVPVITRSGDHFLSHIGETIANNTNLSDWIAFDEDDYILKAVNFSFDLNKLKKLRSQLRAQALSSPLFDIPRFSNNFEMALWNIWNQSKRNLKC